MPPAKKRKTAPSNDTEVEETSPDTQQKMASPPPAQEASPEAAPEAPAQSEPSTSTPSEPPTTTTDPASSKDAAAKAAQDRLARFRSLQERAKTSSRQNLREATRETQRLTTAPNQLTALGRKHAIASHKLLKAEVEDAGGDFERKRAWDWTIEESEKWDARTKKKDSARDNSSFRDYNQEAKKSYKKQLRNMGGPDLEKYTKEKMKAIEKAAAAGTLEIVETEDGEMIAVDRDGTFFSTADSTSFAQHKPDKEAVDRLVADMKKAEEAQLKKRRERMERNADDGGDVTYINEKNKQFNAKLERFYNKYTTEIRNSFERGTMI
ncbi:putative pre-mRNA splicing protein [Rhypophila decipiens]